MNRTSQGASSRHLWVFGGFAVIAGFFLLTEHRAHVLGILPYLLLAACPLMHLFMHHGHGAHRHKDGRQPPGEDGEDRP